MTEQGDPYENALAERINRTIKEDMLQNRAFIEFAMTKMAIERAIANYNTLRPYGSCNYHMALFVSLKTNLTHVKLVQGYTKGPFINLRLT